MRDPSEFAHGLLSARRAFDHGVSCGYEGHTWALWSHSQKGEGLPTGKRVSLWPQEEGGHVRNHPEVPELPGGGTQ